MQADSKVSRWCLNGLALFGTHKASGPAVLQALSRLEDDPDSLAAGIAAVYRLFPDPSAALRHLSFDEQMLVLAALQHASPSEVDTRCLPLRVDTASPELLKLALIVAGLKRAIPNLFDPAHSNAEMVKALGSHQDPIVSQYTIWAVTENSELSISDLGIDLNTIEGRPANVRAWLYQVVGKKEASARKHRDIVRLGTTDDAADARRGLATGLEHTYYDDLRVLILEWFFHELDGEVRNQLMRHLIKHAHVCPEYETAVMNEYASELLGAEARQRMEASAAGTSMFQKFREYQLSGRQKDFFLGRTTVNSTVTNIGTIQAGAVAVGGNVENSGTISGYNHQVIGQIRNTLADAENHVLALADTVPLKQEALADINAARTEPSPARISKVVSTLRKIGAAMGGIIGAGADILAIAQALGAFNP